AKGTGAVSDEVARQALEHFRRAVDCDSGHILARLNLVEALVATGDRHATREQALQCLALLDAATDLPADSLEAGHFPPVFDHFRVEWEAAAWNHAGQPAAEAAAKCSLLRWRLHSLLGDLTRDLASLQQAVAARPDLAMSQASLGC